MKFHLSVENGKSCGFIKTPIGCVLMIKWKNKENLFKVNGDPVLWAYNSG